MSCIQVQIRTIPLYNVGLFSNLQYLFYNYDGIYVLSSENSEVKLILNPHSAILTLTDHLASKLNSELTYVYNGTN